MAQGAAPRLLVLATWSAAGEVVLLYRAPPSGPWRMRPAPADLASYLTLLLALAEQPDAEPPPAEELDDEIWAGLLDAMRALARRRR